MRYFKLLVNDQIVNNDQQSAIREFQIRRAVQQDADYPYLSGGFQAVAHVYLTGDNVKVVATDGEVLTFQYGCVIADKSTV